MTAVLTPADTLSAKFLDLWTLGDWSLRTPIAWPNEGFNPPEDSAWVRLNLLPGGGRSASMGADQQLRTDGILTVQIFTPVGQGDKPGQTLAEVIVAGFWRYQSGRLWTRAPYTNTVGQTADGWYQLNVVVEWVNDTIYS